MLLWRLVSKCWKLVLQLSNCRLSEGRSKTGWLPTAEFARSRDQQRSVVAATHHGQLRLVINQIKR